MDEPMDTEAYSPQSFTSPTATTKQLKIRKKPGRKPNPAPPAVRKAQNRAAQRAFRERKERHMKELAEDTKRLIQERDQYYKESQQLTKENDILKCENWYLKGIVLSLQMVCFKSKLRIPRHIPHIDERARQVMSTSVPPSIAVHLNEDSSPGSTSPSSNNNASATTDKGNDQHDLDSGPSSQHGDSNSTSTATATATSPTELFHTNQDSSTDNPASNSGDTEGDIQPVMLNNHTDTSVSNNMAAIQALRFRLRIQSALFREKAAPYSAKPSVLQLAVPHDTRIDLIPTVHMRDRMILFRDQFDLDDCLRLLINEAVFHGGNPSVAANWELPAAFFEKYWYLTTDYTMERTSQRWRQIKNMFKNDPTLAPSPSLYHRSPSTTSSSSPVPSYQGSNFNTSNDMEASEEAHHQQQQQQQQQGHRSSYHHDQSSAHFQQHYWLPSDHFDQQSSNISTNQQEERTDIVTTNADHSMTNSHSQRPSLVPTDNDILALMTPAPSADVRSHYSSLSGASPIPFTTAQQYGNYEILPGAPSPSSSLHPDGFDTMSQQQQQDIEQLLQHGQPHQQMNGSHPPWNQSYSFMDI